MQQEAFAANPKQMDTPIEQTPEQAAALLKFSKLGNQLTGYLKGRGYHKALKAYNTAKEHHTGFRKDGITPEFQHQIEICLFIATLKEIRDEENTLIAALLHDIREDYGIPHAKIVEDFGVIAADAVEKLTKVFGGVHKNTQTYFDIIATCPIASIVKLADRIHNVSSMVGVFTIKKQEEYLFEIKTYFMPLIKKVKYQFSDQSMSYYAMSTFLKNMSKTIEAVLTAEKELVQTRSRPKM